MNSDNKPNGSGETKEYPFPENHFPKVDPRDIILVGLEESHRQYEDQVIDDEYVIHETAIDFAREKGQFIQSSIKFQNLKRKRNYTSFGYNLDILNSKDEYRFGVEIDVEVRNPIIHQEIKILGLPIIPISNPQYIADDIRMAMQELLDNVESERRKLKSQMEAGLVLADTKLIVAFSRSILRVQVTGHIIQVVTGFYPASHKRVKHLLNNFFRREPPNDPDTN